MRDATSENRTAHAEAGGLPARVSVVAKSLVRGAFMALLATTATAALKPTAASAAPAFHYGTRSLPMDPLFNLPYDPAQVHFDSISLSSIGECAPLLGGLRHGNGQVKLFGQLQSGHGRVLILGDENPAAPRGLSGTVLVMRDGGCRTSGPLLALRRTPVGDPDLDPGLSQADVSMLMRDILTRYARAFGTKQAFLNWTDRLTTEAEELQREQPEMPCPLLYTSLFTQPMMHVLNEFRSS